jgi:hypothetical protein
VNEEVVGFTLQLLLLPGGRSPARRQKWACPSAVLGIAVKEFVTFTGDRSLVNFMAVSCILLTGWQNAVLSFPKQL